MSQHLEALAKANDFRLRRAAQRRKLKALPGESGRAVICAIISSPGDLWLAATLDYVLRMPFGAGAYFSARVRDELSPKKTLGSLTQRQRNVLVDRIEATGRKR